MKRVILFLLTTPLWAQTQPTPLMITRVYGITSGWSGECAANVLDNRNTYSRANNSHSYFASGTGTWSVDMQFSDAACSGPFTSFGTAAQISQASGFPVGSGVGYHPFIKFAITGNASITYSAWRDVFFASSAASIIYPICVAQGGTCASSFTQDGVVLGQGTNPLIATAAGSPYQTLRVPSGGGAPAFGSIDLSQSAAVTGILDATHGGTGLSSIVSGRVVFGGSGVLAQSASLFWDNTNARLGIGTASPQQPLHVVGNEYLSGALMPGGDPGSSGQALVSQGANLAPVWQAVGGGGGGGGSTADTSDYNFASNATSTTTAGVGTVTFTACPKGLNGNTSNYVTITGATNATPIVITTSTNHGFTSGDVVYIDGVGGNTAANGMFSAIVTDATHFSLLGSTGNGAYTTGGIAIQKPNHWVYIDDGGNSEAVVLLTGGTCSLSSLGAGNVKAYFKNTHSASYTMRSATSGIMEADAFLTNGGSVQVRAGSYTLYAAVRLSGNHSLQGSGTGATTFLMSSWANAPRWQLVSNVTPELAAISSATSVSNVVFKGFTVDESGVSAGVFASIVNLSRCQHCLVDEVEVKTSGNPGVGFAVLGGVSGYEAKYNVIRRSKVIGTGGAVCSGGFFINGIGNRVEYSHAENLCDEGFVANGGIGGGVAWTATGTVFHGNTFKGNSTSGAAVHVEDTGDVTITDNQLDGNGVSSFGISVFNVASASYAARKAQIIGNLTYNFGAGIYIAARTNTLWTTDIIISGNTVRNNVQNGMEIGTNGSNYLGQMTISNNIVRDNATSLAADYSGIQLVSDTGVIQNVTITGNYIDHNGRAGGNQAGIDFAPYTPHGNYSPGRNIVISDNVITDTGTSHTKIIDATNATPISVQTAAAHGFTTGDSIYIDGVFGNTAANGVWTITVVDTTHFTLNTSVGNGAYTTGGDAYKGQVQEFSIRVIIPAGTIPDNWIVSNNMLKGSISSSSLFISGGDYTTFKTSHFGPNITDTSYDSGKLFMSGILNVWSSGANFGPLTGVGAGTDIEIGNQGATGNRVASIDLVGDDTNTDYGLRLIRNGLDSSISHAGTGTLSISTVDSAAIQFYTNSTIRGQSTASGIFAWYAAGRFGPASGAGASVSMEFGNNGATGARSANLDLVGEDTNTDYGLRIIRNGFDSSISHRGATGPGNLYITTEDATSIIFYTNNTNRGSFTSAGVFNPTAGVQIGASGATILSHFMASTTWTPTAGLADAAVSSTSVTVTGCTTGMPAGADLSTIGANDVLLTAHVSAANTVRVVLMNKTGAPITIGNGTLRAWCTTY